ncbi:sigma-70 family RNA polymerase sigma factor [Streptomyces sp. CA2R106]|uniref:sigma-70 family RNA polymerase sigma factor n=1 Tax=Streptomyces sp. CA2R106 TaxID=3120153 RepID=UPI0030081DCB
MRQRRSATPHEEPAESADLLRRLSTAGPEQREALRERLVVVWMPMAHRLAGRYRGRGESLEDLRQVAALGLVKAVRRYDPVRGHAFPSFAVPTIDGELKRHFRDYVWSVHVPRAVKELRARVRTACRELGTDDPGAVAAHTALPEGAVQEAIASMDEFSTLSLDHRVHDGTATLHDVVGATDPALETVERREAVRPGMGALTERERMLLYLRYFRDMKQADIGELLGISQMHVSRLLNEICATLRAGMSGEAPAAG